MKLNLDRGARRIWRQIRGPAKATQRLIGVIRKRIFPPPRPVSPDGRLLVHLGCGPIELPGYINVDMMPLPHVHFVGGVQSLPMFGDSSVDLLYACHVLEHVPRRELVETLVEWRRVVKPGGVVRISVPDFDLLLKMSEAEGSLASIQDPLFGSYEHSYDLHHSAFNDPSLRALLLRAGFTTVREWNPEREGLVPYRDWSTRRATGKRGTYFVSLNLEAVR